MYVGGEIADLARIARPSIGVVTAVQAVHLSRIGRSRRSSEAKGELLEALPAGWHGDPQRRRSDRPADGRADGGAAADLRVRRRRGGRGEAVESAGAAGMRFVLRAAGERRRVAIPSLGRLSVHNGLAAAATGLAAGLTLDEIAAGLAAGWSAPHRVALVRLGGVTVVDDTYNASPGSMQAALELLADLPGRRVAVLGEMLELGDAHEAGHVAVGEAAGRVADLLIVVGAGRERDRGGGGGGGPRNVADHRGRRRGGRIDALSPRLREGDVVLVKASRGIGLDALVTALRASGVRRPHPRRLVTAR